MTQAMLTAARQLHANATSTSDHYSTQATSTTSSSDGDEQYAHSSRHPTTSQTPKTSQAAQHYNSTKTSAENTTNNSTRKCKNYSNNIKTNEQSSTNQHSQTHTTPIPTPRYRGGGLGYMCDRGNTTSNGVRYITGGTDRQQMRRHCTLLCQDILRKAKNMGISITISNNKLLTI